MRSSRSSDAEGAIEPKPARNHFSDRQKRAVLRMLGAARVEHVHIGRRSMAQELLDKS